MDLGKVLQILSLDFSPPQSFWLSVFYGEGHFPAKCTEERDEIYVSRGKVAKEIEVIHRVGRACNVYKWASSRHTSK